MSSGSSPPIHWIPIGLGIAAGFLARLLALRSDYRHYPGYPAGYVSHVTLGFLSAVIGAVFFPALAAKEYTAATFLVLAATNFTGVRKVEVSKLQALDSFTLVQRGAGYIQGIAQAFEERNYIAMGVAVLTSIAAQVVDMYFGHLWGAAAAVAVAAVAITLGLVLKSGPNLGNEVDARIGKLHFEKGSLLYVDDVMLMEVGLPKARKRWLDEGVGVIIIPKTRRGAAVLWDLSQRQAIAQSVSSIVGTRSDIGYPERTPLCRMDLPTGHGSAGFAIIPVARDPSRVLEAVRRTPVLENAKTHAVHDPALESWEDEHHIEEGR
ncbi:MAG: YIEGIA domain-containing protein [Thermaerobacter sp.]|nr:YIEGIA domain-containing protein [Thermaerobacter sp.]